jgi:hypothetical protein
MKLTQAIRVFLLGIIASFFVMLPASPASAACAAAGTKTSTSTTAYPNTCYRAQARITRYVSGSQVVVNYFGAWDPVRSRVSSSNGTGAGHAIRGGDRPGGAIGPWGSF